MWDTWKKGFDAWEGATAEWLEQALKSPLVLSPTGHLLTAAMKVKARRDQWVHRTWASFGLSTRRDQERTLHALNELQSRLLDLQDQLDGQLQGRNAEARR
jgi:hypothetical protein